MFLDLDKKKGIAAIDDEGASISYEELQSFGRELSHHVPARTLVFILAENNIGGVAAYAGMLSAQVVPLIISANIDPSLLNRLMNTYHPEFIWAMVGTKAVDNNSSVFEKFGYGLFKTQYTSPKLYSDLSLLLSTSGSTGSPKLVRHSYRNVEANAKNVAQLFELSPADRPLAMLPMHYTMGLSVVTSHLFAGATILITKRSLTDGAFWKFVKEQRATSFTGVPYSFEVLAKLRFFKMNLPDLKLLTQGGGKLKEDLFRAFAEYASTADKKFIATYGQTEGTARMAYLPAAHAVFKIGSIGKSIPNGELFLVNAEKQTLHNEVEGEMAYRGENVTLGYATSAEDLARGDDNNGVLFTGDIARRDADGFYYIVGRVNRFLKIYGLRISLDEIELLIKSSFDIDCACTGTDDKMIVFITDAGKRESVASFITEKTGLYHRSFEVSVIESIRRNESGKVIY